MRTRNVFSVLMVAYTTLFCACTSDVGGTLQIKIVQPTVGEHCRYTVSPATFDTLDSLQKVRGKVGQIVTTSSRLEGDMEILASGNGLSAVDAEFIRSKGVYFPVDSTSLFAASTYYALETGYKLFNSLDTKKDLASMIPNFSDTRVLLRANSSEGGARMEDNAAYLPFEVNDGAILNYFFTYPTNEVKDVPLGLNLGIMVHEYTHMVFQHLFWGPGKDKESSNATVQTMWALDEGMADYFGFLSTRDPGFFLCSFPQENRDLAVPKSFTAQITRSLEQTSGGFDPHEGGTVWAAIQYEIGKSIGFTENGQALYALMPYLLTCNGSGSSVVMNFGNIAKCHLDILGQQGRNTGTARAVYQKYMGTYGAF